MKPRLRDYLTILLALLTIFACGSGVGFLIGEKKGRAESATALLNQGNETGDWETRTMTRLTDLLDLSEDQQSKLAQEVKTTVQKIQASRDEAIGAYHQHLLTLHDQILPHLDPSQQEKIKKERENLQRRLDSRFQ